MRSGEELQPKPPGASRAVSSPGSPSAFVGRLSVARRATAKAAARRKPPAPVATPAGPKPPIAPHRHLKFVPDPSPLVYPTRPVNLALVRGLLHGGNEVDPPPRVLTREDRADLDEWVRRYRAERRRERAKQQHGGRP